MSKPPQTIALSRYQSLLWTMEAEFLGHRGTFVFDTAGGLTVITPRLARSLGCDPVGQLVGFRKYGQKICLPHCPGLGLVIGETPVVPQTVAVYDLMSLIPPDWPELAGMVSLATFEGRALTLDLAGQRLILETGDSLAARTAQARPMSVHFARQASGFALDLFVEVASSKGPLRFLVDTASTAPMLIAPHAARMLEIDFEDWGVHRPPAGEPPQMWDLAGVTLDMVGGGPVTTPATVVEMIYDGLMGAPFLERWVFTFDLATGRGWVTRPGE